jgi:hypothetical protein
MNPGFAVAAATVAFADRLHALIGEAVPGARVTMVDPSSESLRTGDAIVNLYLFRTMRDGATSNRDLPTRGGAGQPMASPTLMLQLDYMISFFGEEARLDPQRLLGLVAGGLNATPYLERGNLRAAAAATPWLGAPPGATGERLRIVPMDLSPEAMARIWSDFVHAPYQLSQFYTVSPVALEVPLSVAPVLPVRRIGIAARPNAPIAIHSIVNGTAPDLPLVGGGTMAIRMADPGQAGISVDLDGAAATGVRAGFDSDGFGALLVDLTANQPGPLTGGPTIVQVRRGGAGASVEAQSVPLEVMIVPGFAAPPTIDEAAEQLSVTMALTVPADAAAAILLFATAGGGAESVRLPCLARVAAGTGLAASLGGVAPGRYFVAVEIDGLASLLDYSGDRYTGPIVVVP